MLVFEEREKLEYPEKNVSEQTFDDTTDGTMSIIDTVEET